MTDELVGPQQALAKMILGRRLVAIAHVSRPPTVFVPDDYMQRAIENGDKPGGTRFPIHRWATDKEAEDFLADRGRNA